KRGPPGSQDTADPLAGESTAVEYSGKTNARVPMESCEMDGRPRGTAARTTAELSVRSSIFPYSQYQSQPFSNRIRVHQRSIAENRRDIHDLPTNHAY